jgi:ethanolamine ammonia-lyase small subunit
MKDIETITPDPWGALREHTPARIALGRSGASLPTGELLRFGFAHAMARDAVHVPLDAAMLASGLREDGWPVVRVHSAAPDRATYLLRPDLGRKLGDASKQSLADEPGEGCDLLLVVGDGLSSLAVSRHARPLIAAIRAQADPAWGFGPIVVAEQARVALGDPIGAAFGTKLVAVLIGERPGLSSPDSLGVYLTWAPKPGRSDAERNCISNIRPEGLGYAEAAHKLVWLAREALARQLTGVSLKDLSDAPARLAGERAPEAGRARIAACPPPADRP